MDINFDDITLSKRKYFKNVKGEYCFINYQNEKLIVDFPKSEVLFDVDFSYSKPNLIIKLKDDSLNTFIDSLDKKLASLCRNEYCSLRKTAPVGKKYSDTLKLKILDSGDISTILRRTNVNLKVHISGMWFDEYSCGPYLNIIGLGVVPFEKKCLITNDSDSEIDIT
jgi:hypothetical protein